MKQIDNAKGEIMKLSELSTSNTITPKTSLEQSIYKVNKIKYSEPKLAYEIAHSNFKKISTDNIPLYLMALQLKAETSWFTSHFQESYMHAQELLKISKNNNNSFYQAAAYMLLGNINLNMDNLDEALFEYSTGLKLARISQNTEIEQLILNRTGQIFGLLNSHEQALDYHQQALELANLNNLPNGTAISYLYISQTKSAQNDFISALEYINKATQIFKKTDNKLGEASSLFHKAIIFINNRDYKNAKICLIDTQSIQNEIGDMEGHVKTNIKIAELYFKDNQIAQAKQIALSTLNNLKSTTSDKNISALLLLLSEIYEKNKNYKKALYYYKQHHLIDNNIYSERINERLNSLRLQSQIKQTNHEKEMFRIKNVELNAKNKNLNTLYDLISVISEIGQNITSTLNLQDVFSRIYKNVNKIMNVSTLGIILHNKIENTLEYPLFITDDKLIHYPTKKFGSANSLSSLCIQNKMDILVNDYKKEYKNYENMTSEIPSIPSSQSMIYVPLEFNKEILGAVSVQSDKNNVFDKNHVNALKALASYIAIAILNAQKSEKLEKEIKEREKNQLELEKLNKKLQQMSYIDALTKIPNRRHFMDRLTDELYRAKRNQSPLSIIIVDIDKFKEYNDNYGHIKGDICLEKVANILNTSLARRTDFVARYGGDEFVIILPDTELNGGIHLANQIMQNVRNANIEHKFSKIAPHVTITMGIYAEIPPQDMTLEQIVHLADSSLYAAKQAGRNRVAGNIYPLPE